MANVMITPQLIWGVVSIFFGLIVLSFPKILNYLVAFYMILIGLLMALPALGFF